MCNLELIFKNVEKLFVDETLKSFFNACKKIFDIKKEVIHGIRYIIYQSEIQ